MVNTVLDYWTREGNAARGEGGLWVLNSQRNFLPADWTKAFLMVIRTDLQSLKDLMSRTLTMRRGLELGLWRRKQSMPPPSSGILWKEGLGEVVKSCQLKLRTCMMRRSWRLWMLSVKHWFWKSFCLQSTMIIIWCSGCLLSFFHHQFCWCLHGCSSTPSL